MIVEWAMSVVVEPAEEPLTLTTVKGHLRVDSADEDTFITALIVAARQYWELHHGRALVTQTLELVLDAWPCGSTISLPRPPLQRVVSITYVDANGQTVTLAATDYVVAKRSVLGRVVLKDGKAWPSVTMQAAEAITVRFETGYGSAAAVPQLTKQGMLLLVGHLYENREAVVVNDQVDIREVPLTVQTIIELNRVRYPGPGR